MGKARVGFYQVSGESLTRTHKSCPKCGPGWFLAEHANRRSCGRCGYMEAKSASEPKPPAPVAAPRPAKAAKPKAPKAPAAAPAATPSA